MLQRVAVWCDVLQCGVVCCRVLQGVAVEEGGVCSSSEECTVFVCVYTCVYAEL